MCNCINDLNEKLKEKNTRIYTPISFRPSLNTLGPLVVTEKVDKKKRSKPLNLFASYCPFCGEKIE